MPMSGARNARVGVDAEPRERLHPGLDADAHGVDERAVEVEEDGGRGAQAGQGALGRPCAKATRDPARPPSWAARPAGR